MTMHKATGSIKKDIT